MNRAVTLDEPATEAALFSVLTAEAERVDSLPTSTFLLRVRTAEADTPEGL